MIKIKKGGFTLSEVLITLAIVGIIAALVIPGVVKDTNNKAMMALLQGTVTNINDVVQNELVRTRAVKLSDTDIFNDTENFLYNFDINKIKGKGLPIFYPDGGYKNFQGVSKPGMGAGTYNASAILKNGVGIAILTPREANSLQYNGIKSALITIDLNGKKEPNISGVDLFELELADESNYNWGVHVGDTLEYSEEFNDNKTGCVDNGYPYACYSFALLSGFNPNYLIEE